MWDGVPVGQWIANLRKAGGLGSDPVRADTRRRALEAIAPDWNPRWPVEWQRHYAAARVLLGEEQGPAQVLPGVTVNRLDIGTWIHRQTNPDVWNTLAPEQSERLTTLALTPRSTPAAPAGKGKGAGAFERVSPRSPSTPRGKDGSSCHGHTSRKHPTERSGWAPG
ncbi:helicase associated domain-containing protein [Streptomyces anulatus]|uniref:helicase associated domain-containing protein n=1 Tax=Streptomyces anulatus TaxID=1892 RepID=UPI0036C7C2AA